METLYSIETLVTIYRVRGATTRKTEVWSALSNLQQISLTSGFTLFVILRYAAQF